MGTTPVSYTHLLPWAAGGADKAGFRHAFVLPIFRSLCIAWRGLRGSKPPRAARAQANLLFLKALRDDLKGFCIYSQRL